MHSLGGCSHITGNSVSNMTYHPYGTIASFSSQSFPRRNISRNSSVITNPMDDFYINNELGGIYAISHMNVSVPDPRRHISNEELRQHSELNALNLLQCPLEGNRQSNEDVSMINADVHNNRPVGNEGNRMDIGNVRFQASVARNGEVTLSIDTREDDLNERAPRQSIRRRDIDHRIDNEEEDNDFGTLADIRESRV